MRSNGLLLTSSEKCPFASLCFGKKYTEEKLRRLAFRDFVGLDAAWEEGMKAA